MILHLNLKVCDLFLDTIFYEQLCYSKQQGASFAEDYNLMIAFVISLFIHFVSGMCQQFSCLFHCGGWLSG